MRRLSLTKDIDELKVRLGVLQSQETDLREKLEKSREALNSAKNAFQKLKAEDGRDLQKRLIEARSVLDALENSDSKESLVSEGSKSPSIGRRIAPPRSALELVINLSLSTSVR